MAVIAAVLTVTIVIIIHTFLHGRSPCLQKNPAPKREAKTDVRRSYLQAPPSWCFRERCGGRWDPTRRSHSGCAPLPCGRRPRARRFLLTEGEGGRGEGKKGKGTRLKVGWSLHNWYVNEKSYSLRYHLFYVIVYIIIIIALWSPYRSFSSSSLRTPALHRSHCSNRQKTERSRFLWKISWTHSRRLRFRSKSRSAALGFKEYLSLQIMYVFLWD